MSTHTSNKVVGFKTYSLIRDLASPAKPSDKTFEELRTLIKNHLKPKPLIIAELLYFTNLSR